MTEHCLEGGVPFGIVLRDNEGARSIGCLAQIEEVLEQFEDGRSNILSRGTEPFRVLDRIETEEWPEAEIERIDDDVSEHEGPDSVTARETFASIATRATGEKLDPSELEGTTAYEIAARIELPITTKQILLEQRNEAERMTLLANALEALERALDQSEEASERAKTNGSVSSNGGGPHS